MLTVLAAGAVVAVAGLLAAGFGLPIRDTTFGNAAILGGVIALCSGLVVVALGLVLRELQTIARLLGQGGAQAAMRTAPRQAPPVARAPAPPRPPTFDNASDAPQAPAPSAPQSPPQSPPPWADEVASRDRVRPRGVDEPAAPAPPPVAAPADPESPPALAPLKIPERPVRRSLLFTSKKREAAEAEAAAAAAASASASAAPSAKEAMPPSGPPESRLSFDAAWPQRGRGDGATAAEPAPADEAQEAAAAPPAQPPAPGPAEPPPSATVIKSGTVDGMAYRLYADGSIEAQMPEGMIRFASLDELRGYLEQRP